MKLPARSIVPIVGVCLCLLVLRAGAATRSAQQRIATVAVFPVENLSGGSIPADEVRQALIRTCAAAGLKVLRTEVLDEFMARHRVRYAAGIDTETAGALRQETGVDGVLIASFEMLSETAPPKMALTARLVSTGTPPQVTWAEDAGLAGDDAPGFFELGVVNDYRTLMNRALGRIHDSLLAFVKTGQGARTKADSKFRPRMTYRAVALDASRPYQVAVVPFINFSDRRNAGEILALLFIRHLSGSDRFRVIDTGVTRRQLLDARIIMDGGLSITDAETVGALVDADYVLGGRVLRYDDYEGPAGRTRVEFSTVLIERKSRKVAWSSESYNEGTDGVHFFERGTTRMAHAMATQMVRLTTDMIAGKQ